MGRQGKEAENFRFSTSKNHDFREPKPLLPFDPCRGVIVAGTHIFALFRRFLEVRAAGRAKSGRIQAGKRGENGRKCTSKGDTFGDR